MFVEREALRDALYDADAVTMRGVSIINRFPAADARPVVYGHWITEEEAEELGDYSLRDACSVCHHCDWDCTESEGFTFCPACGAVMKRK